MTVPSALLDLPALFALRAQSLIALLVVGFFVGEFVARYLGIDWLLGKIESSAEQLVRKLNRSERGIATRIYRGMVAMLMVVLPLLLIGLAVQSIPPLPQLLAVGIFGRGFASISLWQRYRAARAQTLGLELPSVSFLFADSHAVLRYLITDSAEHFSTLVVGASVWYLVGGLPAMLGYVALRVVVGPFRVSVFGWSALSLFRALNAIPRLLTYVLLALGGLFIPGAKPGAVRLARSFHGFVAYLLGVSLGGLMPGRDLTWEGTGTPKLLPEHLARWLLVRLAAAVWLVFTFATPEIAKLLNLLQI